VATIVPANAALAGATVVKIANSIAAAQNTLDDGIPFDAAIVDFYLTDDNDCPRSSFCRNVESQS
jgi:hypothetical protein